MGENILLISLFYPFASQKGFIHVTMTIILIENSNVNKDACIFLLLKC